MKQPQCLLCRAQAEIRPGESNASLARRYGVSKDSARRHRKHVLSEVDPFFTDIPEAIITSRGASRRLEDGSWEKVTYDPRKKALLEADAYEDVERAIENFRYTPVTNPASEETLHVCLADLQIGKVDLSGGTDGTVERVLISLNRAADRAEAEHPRRIVLWDLGDALEGFWNTTQQRQTNDRHLTSQIRTVRRLFAEAIKLFAPLAPQVMFASVPSNHGQVRVGLGDKSAASTPDDDYGIDVNYALEEKFSEHPDFGNLRFVRPDSVHGETVCMTLPDGTVIAAAHGHQANSPDKVGEWWKGQSHGRRGNLHNADILLHGHWHSLRVQHSGDARWVIGAPSIDPGSAWFTNRTGESSKTGMLVFTTRDGQWERMEVL